jgi:1-deoxy-D-xylulose-5-phosphate reductoisomerase
MKSLNFEAPDRERFPTLDFAYDAGKRGGTAPAVLNAANEQAVALFLDGKVTFCGIFDLVGKALAAHTARPVENLEAVLEADAWARRFVKEQGPH